MPDPDSRLWDVENGRECTLNPSPSIQTFHATPGSAPKRNDHEVVEGVESESGSEHRTGLAIFARKPGITAEDVETIRGKGVRFSQVMSSPSSMATSIQTRPLREIGQQLGELVEKDSEVLDEADDLATPLPRRKSFLLSVVHSTARPRLAKPTPHPKARLRICPFGSGFTGSENHFDMFSLQVSIPGHRDPSSNISAISPS